MRVLVLSQHYWPEIAATAQLLSDLCEDLATNGHDVTVVCGQPSYRSSAVLPVSEQRNGVWIRRVWSYTPAERTIPKRLAHYASYFASSLTVALTDIRPDVCVVISTPPLLLGVSGMLTRFLRKVPFVYLVQDLYPDVAIHLGMLSADGVPSRVIESVAEQLYRHASALVTLSPGMARQLAAKGAPAGDIHVIPNWADTDAHKPVARDNAFAREHGLAEGFVVQYSGNLGMSQGLEHIVFAAETLRDLPVTFALVGDGNARASLVKEAASRKLHNVRFLPPQPRDRLPELLGSCDVGLVTMKRGVADDLVPCKLYGIMAAARPVLASVEATSEVARTVLKHDCGWVVVPESPKDLAASVRSAFSATASERARLGNAGRTACEANYSRQLLTARYERLLSEAAIALGPREQTSSAGVTAFSTTRG